MEFSRENEFQIIREILDGRQEKYRVLVDRYAPMVFHVVRRFTSEEEQVEELAQQIFVKTYERLDKFNEKSKFSSWLYMIAKNHCRDYAKNIRRNNKRFSEFEQHELNEQLSHSELPDREVEQAERINLLEQALNQITDEYAEAFLLKYQDGMTYEAMSKRLGATVSALKVRVHRARKELKAYMEQNM